MPAGNLIIHSEEIFTSTLYNRQFLVSGWTAGLHNCWNIGPVFPNILCRLSKEIITLIFTKRMVSDNESKLYYGSSDTAHLFLVPFFRRKHNHHPTFPKMKIIQDHQSLGIISSSSLKFLLILYLHQGWRWSFHSWPTLHVLFYNFKSYLLRIAARR